MDISCQACRNDAMQTLWEDLHDRLYKFIRSRVNDPDDVEDILQEVFLKMHTNLGTIRDVSRIGSWVFQITRNCITDHFRKPIKLPLEKDIPIFDDYGGEDTAENLAPFIQDIVQSLPEKYREAILFTDYQGMNQIDAANTLGISVSGFKSRVQRARTLIKGIMLSCCHFEFDARGIVYDYRDHCCCCSEEETITV
jgi:RNA polymerase sigma-70 factor, ECF subfamily